MAKSAKFVESDESENDDEEEEPHTSPGSV